MHNKQVLFGNNLKALRSKKGINQQELADEIGAVRSFRKSHGNYLRKNQYQDLNIEVYVRK